MTIFLKTDASTTTAPLALRKMLAALADDPSNRQPVTCVRHKSFLTGFDELRAMPCTLH